MAGLVEALTLVWGNLRAEQQLFWTYHWRSKGVDYYGDHLLFQRLYEARTAEIDRMGEVIMAIGGPKWVDPTISYAAQMDVVRRAESMKGASDPAKAASVVADTLQKIELANEKINEAPFPLAVNNVIAGIADTHLESLYLLKQRMA
jgi:DNA-binding ferritin-like protein